jgi:LPXTG-motif cell wall-anchored protein
MKILYYLGLLVGLLLLVVSPAHAVTEACPSQPTDPSGSRITSPAPGATVASPVLIAGVHTRTFEANVPIQILDAAGNVIVSTFTTAFGGDPPTQFETTVTFNVSAPTLACIVVYSEVAPEPNGLLPFPGVPLVQIPVTLSPVGMLPDTGASSTLFPLLGLALALLFGGALVRHLRPFRVRSG